MSNLVATKVLRYGRKDQQPGDRFEASEKDAKILIAIGKAERVPEISPPKSVDLPKEVMSRAPTKETKVETVEPVEVKAQEPTEDTAPKRHYRRRDMSAEQD